VTLGVHYFQLPVTSPGKVMPINTCCLLSPEPLLECLFRTEVHSRSFVVT